MHEARRWNQDPARLRRRRIEAGLTQAALASRAGITPSHMSMIDRGVAGASPTVLQRLADALDCQIADLMPPDTDDSPARERTPA